MSGLDQPLFRKKIRLDLYLTPYIPYARYTHWQPPSWLWPFHFGKVL